MPLFALQVKSRSEEKFVKLLESQLAGVKLYVLKRKLRIRRRGKELDELSPVFPGYVFLEAEPFPMDVLFHARGTELFYKVLRSNEDIMPLGDRDRELLSHFMRFGKVVEASLVHFDEQDRIVVAEGPLKGLEGNIVKVDRRKKRAKLRLDLCGDAFCVDLGYELIKKEHEKSESIEKA